MRGTFFVPQDLQIVDRKYHMNPVSYNAFAYDHSIVPSFPKFCQDHRVHITGLTHDISGYPKTAEPKVDEALVKRLANKIRLHSGDICRAEVINPRAEKMVIAYGSPSNSVYEVVNERSDTVVILDKDLVKSRPKTKCHEIPAHANQVSRW